MLNAYLLEVLCPEDMERMNKYDQVTMLIKWRSNNVIWRPDFWQGHPQNFVDE
jgi:hypothetical protein